MTLISGTSVYTLIYKPKIDDLKVSWDQLLGVAVATVLSRHGAFIIAKVVNINQASMMTKQLYCYLPINHPSGPSIKENKYEQHESIAQARESVPPDWVVSPLLTLTFPPVSRSS